MNTGASQKAAVTVSATRKKAGEGSLEKTVAVQCGQLTIGCSGRRIRAAAEPKRTVRRLSY